MAAVPSRCAECGGGLQEALVLTCGHDLCLRCAGLALRRTRSLSGRTVRCAICQSSTDLCEDAAAALLGGTSGVGGLAASSAVTMAAPDLSLGQQQSPWGSAWPNLGTPTPINGRSSGLGLAGNGRNDLRDAAIEATFNALDRNGNGIISKPEFDAAFSQPNATARDVAIDATFNAMDRNRDGVITRGEFDSAFSPWNRSPACFGCGAGMTRPSAGLSPRSLLSPRFDDGFDRRLSGTPRTTSSRLGVAPPRCPEHPDEPATYFCATCECPCICAECVVQKNGRHRDHEVMRATRAQETLKARKGAVLDEAVALYDEFSAVSDRLAWRRKDVERAASRGRASVRSAFARVRQQLADREAELLQSLDIYETDSLTKLDSGNQDHANRLSELKKLQEQLQCQVRSDDDAVEALNTFAAAKAAIASLRESFSRDEMQRPQLTGVPDDFMNLADSTRAELDLHSEGLATLEDAVAGLCEKGGVAFRNSSSPLGKNASGYKFNLSEPLRDLSSVRNPNDT